MKIGNRVLLMLLIIGASLGCDQVSKRVAKNTLQHTTPRSYLGETFRLEYAENSGAFLSFGANLSKTARTWLFTILSGALLVGLLFYITLNKQLYANHVLALSLILGGGMSNIIDRLVNNGRVIDFMNMGIGSLRTGIFNLADVLIMAGMAMVLILNIKSGSDTHEVDKTDTEPDVSFLSDPKNSSQSE